VRKRHPGSEVDCHQQSYNEPDAKMPFFTFETRFATLIAWILDENQSKQDNLSDETNSTGKK
jgi:hypothetical protein